MNVSASTGGIAIIGLSGRYPQAGDLETYWRNLVGQVDCISPVPADRWPIDGFYCADEAQAVASGRSYSNLGGFLQDLSVDDRQFGISEQEQAVLGLKERLFLDTAAKALSSAGYTKERMREQCGSSVGVYAGAIADTQHYFGLGQEKAPLLAQQPISQIAHRVSRCFDLQGPSIAIDTQSSSGVTAIHLARESLLRGECRMAVAGSVSLLYPELFQLFSRMRVLGSHAGSRSFVDGDGMLLSEGVGAVVLKTLDQARKDGDPILAVIRATSVNHAGSGSFGMTPSLAAQKALFVDVLSKAGVHPRMVSYVETAAYGSPLGDSIEMAALTQAFRQFTEEVGFCAVGSAKSNIGHAEAASGMSQLTKVVLQMQYRQLVPVLRTGELNPRLRLEGSPFYLVDGVREWQPGTQPLRAMVNSFGAGGAYGSLLLEEYRSE